MNKQQWIVSGIALALFLALWLGFDTKNTHQKETDRSRAIQGEVTGFSTILADAKEHLSGEQREQLAALEQSGMKVATKADKIEALKQLSGFWYQAKNIAVAGGYADSVAIEENTPEAWSVAGATYFNGLISAQDNQTLRLYCAEKAVKAFESAASLSPDDPKHRVNLALVYAEQPKADNPMMAVTILRDLEAKYPNEPAVYNALGRLAIKTNQWDKAVQRLEKAFQLDPANPNTPCLLVQAYQGAGNEKKAAEMAEKCKQ